MFNAFRKPSRFDFANVLIDIQGGPTRISNAALKHLRNNIHNMLNTNLAPKFSGLSLQAIKSIKMHMYVSDNGWYLYYIYIYMSST